MLLNLSLCTFWAASEAAWYTMGKPVPMRRVGDLGSVEVVGRLATPREGHIHSMDSE